MYKKPVQEARKCRCRIWNEKRRNTWRKEMAVEQDVGELKSLSVTNAGGRGMVNGVNWKGEMNVV